jgi:hypothetical protein
MAAAVLVLGVLAAAAKTLPFVGQLHRQVKKSEAVITFSYKL